MLDRRSTPLASPVDETDKFLISLALAYHDFDEEFSKLKLPRFEPSGFMIPPRSYWNPGPGMYYGAH